MLDCAPQAHNTAAATAPAHRMLAPTPACAGKLGSLAWGRKRGSGQSEARHVRKPTAEGEWLTSTAKPLRPRSSLGQAGGSTTPVPTASPDTKTKKPSRSS